MLGAAVVAQVALGAALVPWEGAGAAPGRSAGDTEGVSFRQGHNGEILAAALRPVFLHRFCKEPVLEVLAFWAGARPGNYNLLAQIPPAVSKVRSIQPAPSGLVLLLRFWGE